MSVSAFGPTSQVASSPGWSGTAVSPAVAPSGSGSAAGSAKCAPLISAWRHQLEVTRDAKDWADTVDNPTIKGQAQQTAQRDQQIADGMKATLLRLGCPVS